MQKLPSKFLRTVGVVLTLIGLVAAYYAPLEVFVFYLFSEGGRFHYEGFGVGSFWFAALVVQNMGYYVIAALFIPIGLGHVYLRRWALTLTQLCIWFWLGGGILLFGSCLLLIPAMFRLGLDRDVRLIQWVAVGGALLTLLILLPILALWLYKREWIQSAFEEHDPERYWTEDYPFPLLALLFLYAVMILVMHVAIFFQGMFPMFGDILLGRPAAYVIALWILILGALMYGTVGVKPWAWWGSLVSVLLLTVSSAISFSQHGFYDIILMMNLPAFEMEFLSRMILLQDYHLVCLFVVPLLIALGLILYSRKYFFEKQ